MKKLVSTKQLIMILILGMIGLKALFFPSLFINKLGRDSYVFIIFMLLIDFVILLTFLYLKNKFKDMSFYEILEYLFGKVFAKIFMFCFFVYFLNKNTIIFETNYVYLNENLYTNFNWYSFSLPILLVVILVSLQGVNAFARTCEFFVPLILLGFVISLILGSLNSDFTNVLPFMENGVFQDVFQFAFWFGDFLVFIPFFDNLKTEKKTDLKIIISVLSAILLISSLLLVFYAKFNYSCTSHSNAISDLIQASPSISDVGSFEWVLILIWDLALFLYFTLNILGAIYCFRQFFFKINQSVVVGGIALTIFLIVFFNNFDIFFTVDFILRYLKYPCIFVQYGLPTLIFVVALFRREKKNEVSLAK